MGQLVVRNLEPQLIQRLKLRAARRGHSAEAEHREILRAALAANSESSLKDLLLAMPDGGDDADFERHQDLGRVVTL